jgi:acyl-coenzyme A synthetase/AMP-(fatty) acid ligase
LWMNHHPHDDDVYILVSDIQWIKLHIYFITLLGFSHNSSISLLSNLSSLSN